MTIKQSFFTCTLSRIYSRFVGENTNNMIKGLMDNAVRMERELAKKRVAEEAREKAEAKVLELLKLPGKGSEDNRERLRRGEFDHLTVRVAPREKPPTGNPLSDLLDGIDLGNLGNMGPGFISFERPPAGGGRRMGGSKERQTLSVKKALERFMEDYENELTSEDEVIERAKEKCEQFGIVFIDEIDKLCGGGDSSVARASENKGEGVQRELLTLVEGCSVQTRYGPIRTDFILFIASGAFHKKSPSDLLPELQVRPWLPASVVWCWLSVISIDHTLPCFVWRGWSVIWIVWIDQTRTDRVTNITTN